MPGKSVKALIFDMDGVLVNTEPHHTVLEKQLFVQMNLAISDEEHRSYLGKSSTQMWKEIISNHNLSCTADELAEINSEAIIKYFSGLKEIELMPGILDLLEKLFEKGIPKDTPEDHSCLGRRCFCMGK
jgi:beta-phosphoglucomutase-like phosphatase (HAD superfamily)